MFYSTIENNCTLLERVGLCVTLLDFIKEISPNKLHLRTLWQQKVTLITGFIRKCAYNNIGKCWINYV